MVSCFLLSFFLRRSRSGILRYFYGNEGRVIFDNSGFGVIEWFTFVLRDVLQCNHIKN